MWAQRIDCYSNDKNGEIIHGKDNIQTRIELCDVTEWIVSPKIYRLNL